MIVDDQNGPQHTVIISRPGETAHRGEPQSPEHGAIGAILGSAVPLAAALTQPGSTPSSPARTPAPRGVRHHRQRFATRARARFA
ncbi:MAG: hypothetical protein QOE03_1097 [Micromonosporaceae bacterium]|jgi:hypothetical protein|nr:hypothetical protein [Micromonosporaceae bacterium]